MEGLSVETVVGERELLNLPVEFSSGIPLVLVNLSFSVFI
jgi:hypothetical protein